MGARDPRHAEAGGPHRRDLAVRGQAPEGEQHRRQHPQRQRVGDDEGDEEEHEPPKVRKGSWPVSRGPRRSRMMLPAMNTNAKRQTAGQRRSRTLLRMCRSRRFTSAGFAIAAWTVRISVSTLKGLSRKWRTPFRRLLAVLVGGQPLAPTIGQAGRMWRRATIVCRRPGRASACRRRPGRRAPARS
jgi:hypothetical protein